MKKPDFILYIDDGDGCNPEMKVFLLDNGKFLIEYEEIDDFSGIYLQSIEAFFENGVLKKEYGEWRPDVSREFKKAYNKYTDHLVEKVLLCD
jgi:hypothetical protein